VGDLPGLHTAPEFLFGRDQDAKVKRVYWHCDLDPDGCPLGAGVRRDGASPALIAR
jgi:hypothetical protein